MPAGDYALHTKTLTADNIIAGCVQAGTQIPDILYFVPAYDDSILIKDGQGKITGVTEPNPNTATVVNRIITDPGDPNYLMNIKAGHFVRIEASGVDPATIKIRLTKNSDEYNFDNTANVFYILDENEDIWFVVHTVPHSFASGQKWEIVCDGVFNNSDPITSVTGDANPFNFQTASEILLPNVIVGTAADKASGRSGYVISDFQGSLDIAGKRVLFLENVGSLSGHVSKAGDNIEFDMETPAAVLPLNGKTLTITGNNIRGHLKVSGATADSIILVGTDMYLDIQSDNSFCLDLSGADQVDITLNGRRLTAEESTVKTLLLAKTEVDAESQAAANRDRYTGSGFVEWGKVATSASFEKVAEGLFRLASGSQKLYLGGSVSHASLMAGESKTVVPYTLVNGYKTRLSMVNSGGDSATTNYLDFPSAPNATPEATQTSISTAASKDDWRIYENQAYICIADAPSGTSLLNTSYFESRGSVSRADLAIAEVFHRVVDTAGSGNGWVYPNGCIQSLLATEPATGLSTSVGDFAGYDTFSLFGNWQSAGDLVGKGLEWANLTEAQRRKYLAYYPDTYYYNEDGYLVEVSVRVRTIPGLGNEWNNAKYTSLDVLSYTSGASGERVKPKGVLTSVTSDLAVFDANESGYFTTYEWTGVAALQSSIGAFPAANKTATGIDTTVAYKGRCFALPIVLTHRQRNQGAYHPVYNPEGSSLLRYGDNNTPFYWYGLAETKKIQNVNNCEQGLEGDGVSNIFDSFTGVSPSGYRAVKTTTGTGNFVAGTNDEIAFKAGEVIVASFNCALTSGTYPTCAIQQQLGGPTRSNQASPQAIEGSNLMVFEASQDDTGVFQITSLSNDEADYTISNLEVYILPKDTFQSLSDCFTYADTDSGAIADAVSGRPDGLYYDQIDESDVEDLRKDCNRYDYQRYLEKKALMADAGEMRGMEKLIRTIPLAPKVLDFFADGLQTDAPGDFGYDYIKQDQRYSDDPKDPKGLFIINNRPVHVKYSNGSRVQVTDIWTQTVINNANVLSVLGIANNTASAGFYLGDRSTVKSA